jgi:hypothetical protein
VKPTQDDGFKDVWRRKWHSTNEAAPTSKKPAAEVKSTPIKRSPPANSSLLSGQRLWAPIFLMQRPLLMEEAAPVKAGRPPPIILTSTTKLIHLQKQLKNVAKGDFEFATPKTEPQSSPRE